MQCKSEPSPLAQGTLSEHCSHLVRPRFIPACAGNSFATLPSIFERPVHPRLRGELQQCSEHSFPSMRFIPAYAGNSQDLFPRITCSTVHPRLRGELLIHTGKIQAPIGSSPLTRGTPGKLRYNDSASRFIPAYAGNSKPSAAEPMTGAVHPRLRGELQNQKKTVDIRGGSSPLTRGTPRYNYELKEDGRFIPAYAGNSEVASKPFKVMAVHPRLRGELT